jgi:hypothetical protein
MVKYNLMHGVITKVDDFYSIFGDCTILHSKSNYTNYNHILSMFFFAISLRADNIPITQIGIA